MFVDKSKTLEVKKKMAKNGLSEETKQFLDEINRRFEKIKESIGYKMYKQRISDFNHQFFNNISSFGDGLQNSG